MRSPTALRLPACRRNDPASGLGRRCLYPSRATLRQPATTSLNGRLIDLSLSDAVFLGLRGNRTIQSAYLDRIAQKYDLRVAEDYFNPKLVLGGRYVASKGSVDGTRE